MEIIMLILIIFRMVAGILGSIETWNDDVSSNEDLLDALDAIGICYLDTSSSDTSSSMEELREFDFIGDEDYWFLPDWLRRPKPKSYREWRDENVITNLPPQDTAWNDFLDWVYGWFDFICWLFGGGWF